MSDNGIENVNSTAAEFVESLPDDHGLSTAEIEEIKGFTPDEGPSQERSTEEASEEEITDIRQLIADMRIPEKVKTAMFGDAVARMLLISDANRIVQEAVLKNPQIQDSEIESFAKNKNTPENVLRIIAGTKDWTRAYSVQLALVNNPKTPSDVAMKWLKYLRKNDLRKIAKSKNVPNVVSVTARKRLELMEKKK